MIPKHYHVSESGTVVNTKTGKELTQVEDKDGYLYVNIQVFPNVQKKFRVHRLVLDTFHPIEFSDLLQVNHKDGNRKNNKLTNLEWCSSKENIHDRIKRGCHTRKLLEFEVTAIRTLYESKEYSLRSLAELFNVDHKVIWKIVNYKTYVVF